MLPTVLYVLFVLSLMLPGLQALMEGEVRFAGLSRNGTIAFHAAEGGLQEAVSLARLQQAVPGASSFPNSLARGAGTTGRVTYEGCVVGFCLGSPTIFPIRSVAAFVGVSRKVRVLEQAVFKPGFGNILFAPSLNFQQDASHVEADLYATGDVVGAVPADITFSSYARSPQCAASATGVGLPPEVISGTTIALGNGGGGRQRVDTHCPDGLTVDENGTATWECASKSLTEVAPTQCLGPRNARLVPYNWHPMAPIGMPAADFTAVITADPAIRLAAGLLFDQATQDGTEVRYTPSGTYVPSYWTAPPPGPVLIILAVRPFCVNASSAALPVVRARVFTPAGCPQGYSYYGASLNAASPLVTRYIDWGLVLDDLTRQRATLFFQPPATLPDPASFKCPGSSGNACGIRYVPPLPHIDVVAQACVATAFDQINPQDGAACAGTVPPGDVTFTGTSAAPETLVIDNTGPQAKPALLVRFSAPGTSVQLSCDQIDFANANVGTIFVRGNVVLAGNPVFSGYIYATGTIMTQGTIRVRGGIFAATMPVQSGSVNALGPVNLCGRQAAGLPVSPQFFALRTLGWVNVPNDQP